MVRRPWLVLFVFAPGCTPDDPGGASEPSEAASGAPDQTTRVIEVAADGTQLDARRPLTRAALAGSYTDFMGYGLRLRADGSFDRTLGSCGGPVGAAAGTWAVGPEGVALIYTRADGVLATRPPEPMRVAALGPHYLLVEDSWLEMFRRRGPAPAPFGWNLRQSAAEKAVEVAFLRRLWGPARVAEPAPEQKQDDGDRKRSAESISPSRRGR